MLDKCVTPENGVDVCWEYPAPFQEKLEQIELNNAKCSMKNYTENRACHINPPLSRALSDGLWEPT